jgi:hypothetical protein
MRQVTRYGAQKFLENDLHARHVSQVKAGGDEGGERREGVSCVRFSLYF